MDAIIDQFKIILVSLKFFLHIHCKCTYANIKTHKNTRQGIIIVSILSEIQIVHSSAVCYKPPLITTLLSIPYISLISNVPLGCFYKKNFR